MNAEYKTAFEDWITEHTSGKIAKMVGTSPTSVRRWRLGYHLPNLVQVKKIQQITKGKISYREIFEGTCADRFLSGGGK